MKDYSSYDPIDFAQDDDFLKWVKYPGKFPETDAFWGDWIAKNPKKVEEVEMAKKIIQTIISEGNEFPFINKQHEIWVRIQKSIEDEIPAGEKQEKFWQYALKIAAGLLLLVSVSALIFKISRKDSPQDQLLSANTKFDFIEETNNGSKPETIVLSDGSSVVLQPHSSLQYPVAFNAGSREVRLRGEGFFEITKNPNRPFLVHADKIVAKVLGTSFVIRALNDESDVVVQVKTGKVSVFKEFETGTNNNKANNGSDGVVLIPNQQVVYSRGQAKLVKSFLESTAITNTAVKQQFVFHDAPLNEVFTVLEEVYGVEIVYDKEASSKCFLNASLDDMPLYDKMRVISKGLNGKYQISGTKIIFSSDCSK